MCVSTSEAEPPLLHITTLTTDSEGHLARVQVHGRRIEEENWKQRKRKRKNLPPEKQVVAVMVASWL